MDNTTAISHISFGFDTVHLLIKRLDIAQWTAQFLPLIDSLGLIFNGLNFFLRKHYIDKAAHHFFIINSTELG